MSRKSTPLARQFEALRLSAWKGVQTVVDLEQAIRDRDAELERLREALAEATSDQALQYLRRAYRYMETMSEALPDDLGLSLGNIALADDRDWLDCHIDWLERTARSLLSRLTQHSS